jgi:hypothetical protein
MENVTRGGGGSEKYQKSVTYYLNGPLNTRDTLGGIWDSVAKFFEPFAFELKYFVFGLVFNGF